MHSAGVLKYKKQAETLLQQSGLPWTILRPSRLTDGPYTSYDLNTLLQATAGTRQDVLISAQDDQLGEASRIAVAGEACPWSPPLQVKLFCLGTPAVVRLDSTIDRLTCPCDRSLLQEADMSSYTEIRSQMLS